MKKVGLMFGSIAFLCACGSTNSSNENDAVEFSTIQTDYMSKSIKPQDDFFMFANENWIKKNPVPASESRWGSFNELDKANKVKLTAILEDAVKAKAKNGSQDQILGDYYASFKDMKTRNKLGIAPIEKELNDIKNISTKEQLITEIAKMHTYGIGVAFGFGVDQDLKDVQSHTTYFGQGGLGLPNKDYYFDATKQGIREAYVKYITEVMTLAGTPQEKASNIATNVMKFETDLAQPMLAPAEMRIPELTYNKMGLKDLKTKLGKFNFETYLKALNYPSFDTIVVDNPKFVTALDKIYNSTSLDTWKDYLTWCTLNHYAGSLNDKFEKLNFGFYATTMSGKKEMKTISDRAIDEITGQSFGELLGKAFVDKHFSEEAKNRVNSMVDNLLAVYGERISKLDWMSAETKKEADNKLNSIGRKLGFPSKWEDFSSLNFKADSYIENIKQVAQYDFKKNKEKLNNPVDKEEWGMPAHMVNAYYHPLLNEIAFPAGIMQPPFFDNNAEDAVNYGTIGMVIGHEFTHGFDDMGSKFAADGSFKNWWTEGDRKAFESKTGILGETFSAYCPIDGHCVNSSLTMGENIADLGGLTMAYYAYARTEEFKKGEKREGFTPAQRFFIAYAQLWKINYTDEELKKRIATDPHSPGMYRVNGPLQNCPEFFKAFDVKEGDKMRNAEDKVARIW